MDAEMSPLMYSPEQKDSIQYVSNKINISNKLITGNINLKDYYNPEVIIFYFTYVHVQYM